MKKIDSSIIVALLGVILGVLLTLVATKALPEKKFDGDYNRWRKLNLILQEVQKNYVDTIDMAGMTDAAVQAALAELDPHSVYLPPVELTESVTELEGNFDGIACLTMSRSLTTTMWATASLATNPIWVPAP